MQAYFFSFSFLCCMDILIPSCSAPDSHLFQYFSAQNPKSPYFVPKQVPVSIVGHVIYFLILLKISMGKCIQMNLQLYSALYTRSSFNCPLNNSTQNSFIGPLELSYLMLNQFPSLKIYLLFYLHLVNTRSFLSNPLSLKLFDSLSSNHEDSHNS